MATGDYIDKSGFGGKRIRTLTMKGQEQFEERVKKNVTKLERSWKCVTNVLDITDSDSALSLLTISFGNYKLDHELFMQVLSQYYTKESGDLQQVYTTRFESNCLYINSIMDDMSKERNKIDHEPTMSTKSRPCSVRQSSQNGSVQESAGSSVRSSKSVLKAKINAEKAKVYRDFMQKEAELQKQKIKLAEEEVISKAKSLREQQEIDINLKILEEERNLAEAEAEVEVYERDTAISEVSSKHSHLSAEKYKRTEEFVKNVSLFNPEAPEYIPIVKSIHTDKSECEIYMPNRSNPNINNFETNKSNNNCQHANVFQGNEVHNFAKYLMKKDLAVTRLTQFDDKPERYISWKTSFRSVMSEAGMESVEELDLLAKWLGPISANHARSVRATNASNPTEGLRILWKRLDERYGSPEIIEATLRQKLDKFVKLTPKDNIKLYDLLDVLLEVQSVKENNVYSTTFSYFDSAIGINQIVQKLPPRLQSKWLDRAASYKGSHQSLFPPFTYFVEFIQQQTSIMNDPSLNLYSVNMSDTPLRQHKSTESIRVRKTDIDNERKSFDVNNNFNKSQQDKHVHVNNVRYGEICPYHNNAPHSLNDCISFRKKSLEDRKAFIRERQMCFKCATHKHMARDCKVNTKCALCSSRRHPSALHENSDNSYPKGNPSRLPTNPEFEKDDPINKRSTKSNFNESFNDQQTSMNIKCTEVCRSNFGGKSCAKVQLVSVYPKGKPEQHVAVYAVLDDQCNRTLASSELFNALGVKGNERPYTISTCTGESVVYGRRAEGFVVRSIDGQVELELPITTECENIPRDHTEIPSPEVALNYDHLRHIAHAIPSVDKNIQIGLLIGRDLIAAHYVHDQVIGPTNTPFAQKLPLGWVIIGEACLGKTHRPNLMGDQVQCFKTFILKEGRSSIFEPCESQIMVKDNNLFVRTQDDEKIGKSQDDQEFIKIMNDKCHKDSSGFWTAPLPFKSPKVNLPNNRKVAWKRAMILDSILKRDPIKREQFVEFMKKVLDNGAAEVAPEPKGELWYLPLFGVSNPKKPGKIRGVFDSSADCEGVSLNSTLLAGPNLTNNLLHILLRFRKNKYAISGDIEQMFYRFLVQADHRDYLRFFWYRDNDPKLNIVEYRMKAHVFGNSPSPAVATYALHKSVENASLDVKNFVENDFYVDDALTSKSSSEEAVDIMKQTQRVLKENGNIRLHKIVSNSQKVLKEFPEYDLGEGLKSEIEDKSILSTQRSLGMTWDLNNDNFSFDVEIKDNIRTKRQMLSFINSIFDPIGFLSPIVIHGRILLRELTADMDWDEIIPPENLIKWNRWMHQISKLGSVEIPRMFVPFSIDTATDKEIHIYCDASEKAVAAVAYISAKNEGVSHTGFVMGKTKLAPTQGHTIPRLELCSAVLAVEIGECVSEALNIPLESIRYHSDSRIVLGYIGNKVKRFHTYVSNCVEKILLVTQPKQWAYVTSSKNPADKATRATINVENFETGPWLNGPKLIRETKQEDTLYPLVNPTEDSEIRQEKVKSLKSGVQDIFCNKFERFSDWRRLVGAIMVLKAFIRKYKERKNDCVHECKYERDFVQNSNEAEQTIIKIDQESVFSKDIVNLRNGKYVENSSPLKTLNPFLDEYGILRVGGRLNNSELPFVETHPIILHRKSHIAKLIVESFHTKVKHQGRLITESAVRNGGYWILGAKRLISNITHHCFTCRKLRGKSQIQQMGDLPNDRVRPGPPFSSVGVDTFGPWMIVTRKTRSASPNTKRWAIMFTCLTTRAIHIEVVEDMTSSSFINALRRLVSLRGEVKEIRSDCGTNFVGAAKELKANVILVNDPKVSSFLNDNRISWRFNPPHSSHMGGVWERMIGLARRVLDAMLLGPNGKYLTHEVLCTLMAEVCAIVNSRPIGPLSTDPLSPEILTPATIITQRFGNSVMIQDNIDPKDLYRSQWRRVQALSDIFWKKWKDGYLQTLQVRQKWQNNVCDLEVDDIILLKDKTVARNEWKVGIVVNAIKSESDKKVRKIEVRVIKDGIPCVYIRPVTEVVLLEKSKKTVLNRECCNADEE